MKKQKKYKVWVEYEKTITAYSKKDAENQFEYELDSADFIINSEEIK